MQHSGVLCGVFFVVCEVFLWVFFFPFSPLACEERQEEFLGGSGRGTLIDEKERAFLSR